MHEIAFDYLYLQTRLKTKVFPGNNWKAMKTPELTFDRLSWITCLSQVTLHIFKGDYYLKD